jgi:DnaJ-class molecular chaperone
MDWRRLLRRGPEPNPETPERVQCDLCNGTGFELVGGQPWLSHGVPTRCMKCMGKGWLTVDKQAD